MDRTGSLRECAICCNDTSVDAIIVIEGDSACHGCVRSIFQYSVESEENFPPVWAGQPLKLENYAYILDAGLIEEFRRKTEQYAVPWDQRVVCRRSESHAYTHSKDVFVGRSQTTQRNVPCPECGILYCLCCSQAVAEHDAKQHSCRQAEAAPGYEGLKQGKDYQLCPSCKSAVQLRDGCNHLMCVCTQQFCFVCGQPATNNSNHWVRGRCPRYNHAVTGAPLWQEDIDEMIQRQRALRFGRAGTALRHAVHQATRQARMATIEGARQLGRFARHPVTSTRLSVRHEQQQQRAAPVDFASHATPALMPAHPWTEGATDTTTNFHGRLPATEQSVPRTLRFAAHASDDRSAGTHHRIDGPPQPSTSSQTEQSMFHHSSHANNRILASALQADIAALSSVAQNEDSDSARLHQVWPQAQTDFQSFSGEGRLQSLSAAGSLLGHHRHAHPRQMVTGITSTARHHEYAHHAGQSAVNASSLARHHFNQDSTPVVDTGGNISRLRPHPARSDAIALPRNTQQRQSQSHVRFVRHYPEEWNQGESGGEPTLDNGDQSMRERTED